MDSETRAMARLPFDFEQICRGLGIESLHKVDSTDEAAIERALGEELPKPGVSVIIASAHSAD